ncbi:hypothetical protein GCM10023324_45230 [Streptomyces youssoufiensis]
MGDENAGRPGSARSAHSGTVAAVPASCRTARPTATDGAVPACETAAAGARRTADRRAPRAPRPPPDARANPRTEAANSAVARADTPAPEEWRAAGERGRGARAAAVRAGCEPPVRARAPWQGPVSEADRY